MRAFTEREDELLRKWHEQGMSIGHQAFQLNRPYGSVCSRRNTLGLKYFTRGKYNKGQDDGNYTVDRPSDPECISGGPTTDSNLRQWSRLMRDPEAISIALAGIIVFAILFGAPIFGYGSY